MGLGKQQVEVRRFNSGIFEFIELLKRFVDHFEPQTEFAEEEAENQIFFALGDKRFVEIE